MKTQLSLFGLLALSALACNGGSSNTHQKDSGESIEEDSGTKDAALPLDASLPPPPETIVLDASAQQLTNGQNQPRSLALVNGNLYWTSYGVSEVMTMPTDGGAPSILASGQHAFAIAANSNSLFWVDDLDAGSVFTMPIDGGAVQTLATNQEQPFAIVANEDYVYFLDIDSVRIAPLDGGVLQSISASTQVPSNNLALTATNLYWTSGAVNASVMQSNLDGTNMKTLATGQYNPTAIGASAESLYWANYGDIDIMTMPLAGGNPRIILTATAPWGLVVDTSFVYCTLISSGKVVALSLDGTKEVIMADGISNPYALVQDSSKVYWTTYNQDGGVFSIGKPSLQ